MPNSFSNCYERASGSFLFCANLLFTRKAELTVNSLHDKFYSSIRVACLACLFSFYFYFSSIHLLCSSKARICTRLIVCFVPIVKFSFESCFPFIFFCHSIRSLFPSNHLVRSAVWTIGYAQGAEGNATKWRINRNCIH